MFSQTAIKIGRVLVHFDVSLLNLFYIQYIFYLFITLIVVNIEKLSRIHFTEIDSTAQPERNWMHFQYIYIYIYIIYIYIYIMFIAPFQNAYVIIKSELFFIHCRSLDYI